MAPSGAAAMHTMPIKACDTYEGAGGTYARRYHDHEHVNEADHTRQPTDAVPAAVC